MPFNRSPASTIRIEDPPLARLLFSNTKMAWFWLVVRLYVGYAWLEAGLHKVDDPKWVGDGSACWATGPTRVTVPAAAGRAADHLRLVPRLPAVPDRQRQPRLDGQADRLGELLIGVGLIVGAFVGVAAFFGALMNMNFMLAGSAAPTRCCSSWRWG